MHLIHADARPQAVAPRGGASAGDLYAPVGTVLPPVDTEVAQCLYREMADQMRFDPRAAMETRT